MPYGTVKVDNVTFTYNAADATTTFSGFYASTTNNLTLSGTASAATFTGTTASFTNINAQNISVTTALSGLAITGGTAGFTTVTGTTVTGTTANFASGVFTTRISGVTITGTTVSTTTGNFISLTGTTATITSGIIASGTAALPSLAILSDPNTGIYSPGADQLAISTNGTGRLFVDASGNVGVAVTPSAWRTQNKTIQLGATGVFTAGTSATSLLGIGSNWFLDSGSQLKYIASDFATNYEQSGGNHIWYRAASGTAGANLSWSEQMRLTSTGLGIGTSSPSYLLDCKSTGATNVARFLTGSTNSSEVAQFGRSDQAVNLSIDYDGAGSMGIGTTTAHPFNLKTGAVTRATIDTSGRLGIGTTDIPSDTNFTVLGNFQSGFYRNITSGNRGYNLHIGAKTSGGFADGARITGVVESGDSTGYLSFGTRTGGVISEKAQIDSSGRLLVGTSTAQGTSIFQAVGNSAASTDPGDIRIIRGLNVSSIGGNVGAKLGYIRFGALENTVCATIEAQSDGTWSSTSDTPGCLVFSTTADGASSPTERMRITQAGHVFANTTSLLDLSTGTTAGINLNANNILVASRNGGESLALQRSGTDGSIALFFKGTSLVGSISVTTTATAYNTSSDYRLKENVTAVTDGITRLQQLKPSRFNFIADPAKTVDGFIAHEVQSVVPEAITGEKDAVDDEGNPIYQGIDQSKLVPLLTAALQEAIAKIETLEAKVAALEAA